MRSQGLSTPRSTARREAAAARHLERAVADARRAPRRAAARVARRDACRASGSCDEQAQRGVDEAGHAELRRATR